jgi:hypothetical protein
MAGRFLCTLDRVRLVQTVQRASYPTPTRPPDT